MLLSGDVPLLKPSTVQTLVERHRKAGAAATVVTAVVEDPASYGRIVRSGQNIARIVEDRDATKAEREIREINSGIYAFEIRGLFEAVRSIARENAQGEYYLPDLVEIFRRRGAGVETVCVPDPDEIRGINSRAELAAVSRIVRDQQNSGVDGGRCDHRRSCHGLHRRRRRRRAGHDPPPRRVARRRTTIGAGCEIHSGVRIVNSHLGDRVTVLNHCVITDSRVAADARIGPFAHLRNEADVRDRARVGNFVEVKKTVLGAGSKAMHLAYLGDATIGEKVNVGAGVITCNYDGVKKHQTVIEDGAFIGSDTQLIAPVTVGKGAYVGTGTTVREDVPGGALAVSAGKQRNIDGWVEQKRKERE